jgi:hypothetical protein
MAAMAREAWDASVLSSAAERRRAGALVPVRFRVHAETLSAQRVVGTSNTSGATLFWGPSLYTQGLSSLLPIQKLRLSCNELGPLFTA